MQPSLKKIDNNARELFQVNRVDEMHFYPLWHFHPQCEIIIIEEGSGTLYIGDGIGTFKPGDIIIFGANIPHLLRNYPEYFKPDSELRARATVIYFDENYLGDHFLNLETTSAIKDLLRTVRNGMILKGNSKQRIKEQIYSTIEKKGFDKFINFLILLNIIGTESKYNLLSSIGFTIVYNEKEVNRLNIISDYLLKNFTRTIRLKEVADIAYMSETAFCRYFKEKTNKTLIAYINEIRIGYACRLLIEKQHINISQVCFKTGFNNLTNFNIQFKKLKNCSPLEYKTSFKYLK